MFTSYSRIAAGNSASPCSKTRFFLVFLGFCDIAGGNVNQNTSARKKLYSEVYLPLEATGF